MLKTKTHTFNTYMRLFVFMIAFAPCILSNVFNIFMDNAVKETVYWIISFVLVLLTIQRGHKLYMTRKSMNWIFAWMLLWMFSIWRNGDLANGWYSKPMQMLACILMVGVFLASKYPVCRQIFMAMELLLMIQLTVGFYYFIFPQKLLPLGTSFFHLQGLMLSKFNNFVQAHYFMGLVSHYSTSGIYMALAVILLLAECLESKAVTGKMQRGKYWLFLFFGLALILTQKRGPLVFTGCACMAMYYIGYIKGDVGKKVRQMLAGISVVLLIVILIFRIPALSGVVVRFATRDLESSRADGLWLPAWNGFTKNWLLGIGWGQYKWNYLNHQGKYVINNNAHNIYLQLLCENGILFGSLVIFWLIYVYIFTWKNLRRYKKEPVLADEYMPMLFSFGYQTFFLLYGITGNPLYDIECLYPYLLSTGIAFRYAYVQKIKQHQ